MDKFTIISQKRKGKSNREIQRETGIDRKTVASYWAEYNESLAKLGVTESDEDIRLIQEDIVLGRRYDTSGRKPTKYTAEVDALLDKILAEEEEKDKVLGNHKQQLTHEQIHQRITAAGHDIGRTTLSAYIKLKRDKKKEAFISQEYDLGERLEYDFGDVKLIIGGILGTYHMAVFGAPASKSRWAYLYDNMKKEVFMDSHVRFFEMLGGVHKEIVYDNMKNVVTRFIGRNEKELNTDLVKMSLYYGFNVNVTNCFRGNEKGFVESSVKKLQRQVFAERYEFDSIQQAEDYLHKRLKQLNKDSLIEEEKKHLLPSKPMLELGRMVELKVDKYSFIQIENNYYSVPEHLVGHRVKAKIYLKEVLVYSNSRLVATHKKVDGYQKAQVDIYHYLETLEKKPGALKNSKALKSRSELKTIYDRYFTKRTKEFIGILRDNSDKSYPQLLEILKENALMPAHIRNSESSADDNVTSNTKDQLRLLSKMFMKEGFEYVN